MTGSPTDERDGVVGPSDRSFGLTFAVVFAVVALLPLWRGGAPRSWAAAVAGLVFALALAWPRALAPANRLWLRVGLLMHRVVNPVVMAVLFYGVVTPFGLVARLFGAGMARRLRPDPKATSYWTRRQPNASRMDQQF
jgi:hypothetical protein